jgi:hypothetical protein
MDKNQVRYIPRNRIQLCAVLAIRPLLDTAGFGCVVAQINNLHPNTFEFRCLGAFIDIANANYSLLVAQLAIRWSYSAFSLSIVSTTDAQRKIDVSGH